MARENGSAGAKKFTVGLIQMRSTANGDENRSRAAERFEKQRTAAHKLFASTNCLDPNISAAKKIRIYSR